MRGFAGGYPALGAIHTGDAGKPAGGEGRAVKSWKGQLFDNVLWKLVALAIAVVIWWLVASEPELSTFARVRLEYKNLPDDLEISSEPVGSIALELRGPSGELRGVGNGGIQPAVILDMAGVLPGE